MHKVLIVPIYLLIVAVVLFFTYSYFRKRSVSTLYFVSYIWAMLLTNLLSSISNRLGFSNLYLSHFYFWIQFVIISLLFRSILVGRISKKIITYVLGVVPVILLIQYVRIPGIFFKMNPLEVLLCSLPLCTYAIFYLFQLLEERSKKWLFFSTGLFIYLMCSSIVFVGANFFNEKFAKMPFWGKNFWIINNFVYMLYLVLLIVEWVVSFRKTNVSSVIE